MHMITCTRASAYVCKHAYTYRIIPLKIPFVSVPGFGIRTMSATLREFETVPSSSVFWKSSRRIGFNSSLNVW